MSRDSLTIDANGTKCWFKDGLRHRDGDKPAVIFTNGTRYWYKWGLRHRSGGRPAIVYADGTKEHWEHGECWAGQTLWERCARELGIAL